MASSERVVGAAENVDKLVAAYRTEMFNPI